VWGKIAVVLVLLTGNAAARTELDPAKQAMFPVIVDAATMQGRDGLKSGDVFYEQTLRSAKAIRLKTDLPLMYKTRDRGLGWIAGSRQEPITIKAGQIFVVARYAGAEIYCSSVSDKIDDNLARIYEVAVCLKDGDGDGKLEQALGFESYPYRARVPYEIGGIGQGGWLPVNVEYEPIALSDIPPIHLSFHYRVFHAEQQGMLSSLLIGSLMTAQLTADICWPQALLSQTAGVGGECGIMNWFALKDAISTEPNAKGTLSVPEMTVVWQRNQDATLKAEMITPVPAGAAMLSTGSWIVFGGELRAGRLLVKITPAVQTKP